MNFSRIIEHYLFKNKIAQYIEIFTTGLWIKSKLFNEVAKKDISATDARKIVFPASGKKGWDAGKNCGQSKKLRMGDPVMML
jgi:hypothetical protein